METIVIYGVHIKQLYFLSPEDRILLELQCLFPENVFKMLTKENL